MEEEEKDNDINSMLNRMDVSDEEEEWESQIGNGTREEIEAWLFNDECGDR
jgi:hypothetical protein